MRHSVQRGSNPQGCEASRASARRSTLLAPKFYKIRRMADFLLRHSVQRGSNPQGCEASRASARRSTLLAPKFYKIRRMADFLLRHSVQRGSNPQGNIPSSSSSGGVARVSVPGWSNPQRPQFGQHTPVTRTHQCPPHPVGAGGVIACDDGGWGNTSTPLSLRRSAKR